eukprot:gene1059-51445_t
MWCYVRGGDRERGRSGGPERGGDGCVEVQRVAAPRVSRIAPYHPAAAGSDELGMAPFTRLPGQTPA